jgi:hypothetical protein
MTEYIVEKELLPIEEVEMIVERAPQHLMSFQESVADIDIIDPAWENLNYAA